MIPHIPASCTLKLMSVIKTLMKIGGITAIHLHKIVVLVYKLSLDVTSPKNDELFSINFPELGKEIRRLFPSVQAMRENVKKRE